MIHTPGEARAPLDPGPWFKFAFPVAVSIKVNRLPPGLASIGIGPGSNMCLGGFLFEIIYLFPQRVFHLRRRFSYLVRAHTGVCKCLSQKPLPCPVSLVLCPFEQILSPIAPFCLQTNANNNNILLLLNARGLLHPLHSTINGKINSSFNGLQSSGPGLQ